MKPSQANKQDWRMYYSGTWMHHITRGPGYIQVLDGDLHWSDGNEAHPAVQVEAADLECWWPRSGSYNTPGGAVYIARRAARNMRKSACMGDHYRLTYGHGRGDCMALMVNGPDYVTIKDAVKAINKNIAASIAITRDIIVTPTNKNEIEVVFRGNPTGILNDDGFEPYIQADPLAKRAYIKLMQEGVL